MHSRFLLKILLCLPLAVNAEATEEFPKQVDLQATRISEPLKIDGIMDEPAWQRTPAVSAFTQRDPVEFGTPTEKTEARMLYDDNSLYVGVRMFDSAPDSIMTQLARHDYWTQSDELILYLDPYLDRRTGYYFGVNAAGTTYDGEFYNDHWSTDAWDGVWEGKVTIDEQGWCVEFRLPFSQMRFHADPEQTWGINFKRIIRRKNEWDYLAFKPKNGSGFVSRYWDMKGLSDIPKPRYFEVMPFVSGKARFESHDEADPFNDGSEFDPSAGVDFKVGLGSNLTLNATMNPDFGQVEVDPAVVNLSDVETFFSEKRPFFIEGSNTFSFGSSGATDFWGFNWSGPRLFYSRRIGRSPQGNLPDNDYADVPDGTSILGAGKLTGKLRGDWSIGSLHAVTAREIADIEYEGKRSKAEVEPATYYTVTRAAKEIQDGFRGLGVLATGTHRFFDDERLKANINGDAYTTGLDAWTFLDKDRNYALTGWGAVSHVRGTEERITSLQRSSRHYFQRPDVSHVSVDSSATSMTGWSGRVLLNKEKGPWILNTAIGAVSPEFDVNDIGFQSRSDLLNQHFGFGRRWTETTSWTRFSQIIGAVYSTHDFDGNITWMGMWGNWSVDFLNYWRARISMAGNPETVNNTATRGGPRVTNRPGWELNTNIRSDPRKPVAFDLGTYGYTRAKDSWDRTVWGGLSWRPIDNLSLSFYPEFRWADEWTQWVDRVEDESAGATFGNRYIFAELDQRELSASIRLNWTFTPKLSLQVYAQPLMSAGDYTGFKELEKPNSDSYRIYPEEDIELDPEEDEYSVDPDGDGPAEPIQFGNPDFDFQSLRGNMILRWEYALGSSLYLVWTHGRSTSLASGNFDVNRSVDGLFSTEPDNIFLLKATHWFSL